MIKQIKQKIEAAYAALFLISAEEARVEGEIAAVAASLGYDLHVWTCTKGVVDMRSGLATEGTQPPVKALAHFEQLVSHDYPQRRAKNDEAGANVILLLKDFHLVTASKDIAMIRRVKEVIATARNSNRVLMVLGCEWTVCKELDKEFTRIEVKLPDREQLRAVAQTIADSAGIKINGNTEAIVDAMSGLTTLEAADAASLAAVESGRTALTPAVIHREKAATLKKGGILEIVDTKTTLDDIGGLEELKDHLFGIRKSFTKEAREYGLPSPRPLLVVGQPGTGKSLCATACGNIFGVPLLRLEAGRLFGSLQGETEGNWRGAFATAKAISPVVLWIDEVDGLFSGGESSGRTDGGTTQRLIKTILQDMQMNSDGILFAFTANDIDQLPDPLIDRCEVWSVDLPVQREREDIWKIQIAKRGRKPGKYDCKEFGRLTEGFSGRQIEQAWVRAMSVAFNADGREPKDSDVRECVTHFVPTSKTMAESIERRRKRLAGRAQPASKPETAVTTYGQRKIA